MTGFDEVVPGLGEILAGTPTQQQQQPPAGGFLAGAGNWLQQNPDMTNMLLGTMMAAAQGHNLGNAVAQGAKMTLVDKADKAQQQRQKDIEDRKMQMDQERLGMERQRTEASVASSKAQTEQTTFETGQKKELSPLVKAKAEKELTRLDAQIAREQDETKLNALQMRRQELLLTLDEKFSAKERQAELSGKGLRNQNYALSNQNQRLEAEGKKLDNQGKLIQNARADMEARDSATLTPEQRLGKGKGTQPTDFFGFLGKNGKLFLDPDTGQLDMVRAAQAFDDAQKVATKGTATATAPTADTAGRQARYDAALKATRPGGMFTFEGKTYVKGAK